MRKIIIAIVLFGVVFFIGAHILNQVYNAKIKRSPKKYVYQTYWGLVNSALIIEDLQYGDSIIAYYSEIEKDSSANPTFNFPLKTLPQYEPVYVVGYSKDSVLVEVVSYYERGPYFGGSYLRGWVYKGTIHDKPAEEMDTGL